MCGRFVSSQPADQLATYFGAQLVGEAATPADPGDPTGGANYNVAPTTSILTVVESGAQRVLDRFRWGLVPFWAKDLKVGNKMINARAETLATKNAYKRSFARRRCLIPADGFYEWMTAPGLERKQPVYIHPADAQPLAFAGIWDTWRPKDADDDQPTVRSCTIITTAPNQRIARVHDRMPVILAPADWERWLDPDFGDLEALEALLVPAPDDLLVIEPVSTAVNNVRSRGPELIARIEPEVDLGLG